MQDDADVRAFEAVAKHPRSAHLVAIARAWLAGAVETRRADGQAKRVEQLAEDLEVTREQAATPFGNALELLLRESAALPEDDGLRALACALAAHVIAATPPKTPEELERAADDLLWLAAHTPFDATGLLDRALGDAASSVWDAIGDRIRRIDEGKVAAIGRGEALIGGLAIASSRSKAAAAQADSLAADVRDRKMARLLRARSHEEVEPIVGEMTPAPRGAVPTALLAMTGILLVWHALRFVARVALAYRKPARVTLADDGAVRIQWRIEMLGRTLRDRYVVVPRGSLLRATREVRYPRLALYAGLVALAAGSYVGVATFVDGVRVASPSLLATGLAIVALGLALDFALSSASPGSRGRCRVLLVPRDGAKLCVGDVDVKRADAALARIVSPKSARR